MIYAFHNAAFAFSGTEPVGVCVVETSKPEHSIPGALKQIVWIWRVVMIYMLSLLILGILIPWDTQLLLGEYFTGPSPFISAIALAGVPGLCSVMNAVILVSVSSMGNSAIYCASRVLSALSAYGHAPKFFTYVDRSGRPLVAIISSSFGFLAVGTPTNLVAFYVALNWMVGLCGYSTIFVWASICFAHI